MNAIQIRPLVAAVALAAGTQALGDVIRFDNPAEGDPGHFDWTWDNEVNPLSWLDITQPSTNQGDVASLSSVAQVYGKSPISVLNATIHDVAEVAFVADVFSLYTLAFDLGETIDPSFDFSSLGSIHVEFRYDQF